MLPVQFIRDEKARVLLSLEKRGFKDFEILDRIIAADDKRKNIQKDSDDKKAELNRLSKEIGLLMKDGKREAAEAAKAATVELKNAIDQLDTDSKTVQEELQSLLLLVPNCLNSLVPHGKSSEENEVYKDCPHLPELPADALPHWELAAKYKLIDFETGVKITGSRFSCLYWKRC